MTDAFAAEESQARSTSRRGAAYIFLGHAGNEQPDPTPYRDRHLEPIFYNHEYDHVRLKETLLAWADAREDYFLSTGGIIERSGPNNPQALDPSDVDNLLWAIIGRHKDGGHGAKVFADLEKPPPIGWLVEIERRETAESDAWTDANPAGSDLLPRPILHLHSLTGVPTEVEQFPLTQTAFGLARWLLQHMETLELVDWVIENLSRNRRLHFQFRMLIRKRLMEEKSIRPGFATFWRIVAAEGAWNRVDISDFAWMDLLQEIPASPDAAWLREEFLTLLRPYLRLSPAFWRGAGGDAEHIGDSIDTVAYATVRLVGHDHLHNIVAAIDHLPDPDGFLARLPTHLTDLLEKALDLYALAGRVSEDWDPSVIDRPSIQPHSQNSGFREWTVLFDLLWRSWKRIDQISPAQSRALVHHWQASPYSAFRRLAVAAVTVSRNFTSAEKAEVLLDA